MREYTDATYYGIQNGRHLPATVSPDAEQFLRSLAHPVSDADTLRLWRIAGYRIPPAEARQAYIKGARLQELITDIYEHVATATACRLEGVAMASGAD